MVFRWGFQNPCIFAAFVCVSIYVPQYKLSQTFFYSINNFQVVTVLCYHSLHIKTSDIACFSPAAGGKALGQALRQHGQTEVQGRGGGPADQGGTGNVQQGRGVRDSVIPAHVRGAGGELAQPAAREHAGDHPQGICGGRGDLRGDAQGTVDIQAPRPGGPGGDPDLVDDGGEPRVCEAGGRV